LAELLDLDTAGAARTYAAVITDNKAQPGRRFVAFARLLELQRIGAVEPVSLGFDQLELPQELLEARDRLATARQLAMARRPFEGLVEKATADPQGLATWIEQGERGQFNQRTLVQQIYNRALEAADASTAREHHRQLRLQLEEATRRNDRVRMLQVQMQLQQLQRMRSADEPEGQRQQRVRALSLLRHELAGEKSTADWLRAQQFRGDQRPAMPSGTPEEVLDLVRHNLAQLSSSKDLLRDEGEALQKLQGLLESEAATKGAPAALLELNRLPVYRTLLLRPR
jgi:hypothetical protein